MLNSDRQNVALITGTAGFIGFHVAQKLLKSGWKVVGVDCLSDYYDVQLKERRERILIENPNYESFHEKIEKKDFLLNLFKDFEPDVVIHLAAQAGVRFSIENPRSYLESNIVGSFELLEAARIFQPKHLLLASTSSVYGANSNMPYKETDKADHQVSFYAATKKSIENIAHSYSHLFGLPITMFRFFTVYGPWGRPDMAPMKFLKAILRDDPIDIYNHGKMARDFTFIDDLTKAIELLIGCVPQSGDTGEAFASSGGSPVAPYRVVNIGNSEPIELMDFISALEKAVGKIAKKNFMEMQSGDVERTWADTTLLKKLTGFSPDTSVEVGTRNLVEWYSKSFNF